MSLPTTASTKAQSSSGRDRTGHVDRYCRTPRRGRCRPHDCRRGSPADTNRGGASRRRPRDGPSTHPGPRLAQPGRRRRLNSSTQRDGHRESTGFLSSFQYVTLVGGHMLALCRNLFSGSGFGLCAGQLRVRRYGASALPVGNNGSCHVVHRLHHGGDRSHRLAEPTTPLTSPRTGRCQRSA